MMAGILMILTFLGIFIDRDAILNLFNFKYFPKKTVTHNKGLGLSIEQMDNLLNGLPLVTQETLMNKNRQAKKNKKENYGLMVSV